MTTRDELREVAQALLDACIHDFGLDEGNEDYECVAFGQDHDSVVTFGHMRRLKTALTAGQSGAGDVPCPDAARYDRGECCGGACLVDRNPAPHSSPPRVLSPSKTLTISANTSSEVSELSCDEQLAIATEMAANIGYVLVEEPTHPDSPHAAPPAPAADLGAAIPDTFSIAKNAGDNRFLSWLCDRLVHVYGESPNVDFVQTLRRFADAFEPPAIKPQDPPSTPEHEGNVVREGSTKKSTTA